jgi:hypothetical protein
MLGDARPLLAEPLKRGLLPEGHCGRPQANLLFSRFALAVAPMAIRSGGVSPGASEEGNPRRRKANFRHTAELAVALVPSLRPELDPSVLPEPGGVGGGCLGLPSPR